MAIMSIPSSVQRFKGPFQRQTTCLYITFKPSPPSSRNFYAPVSSAARRK